MHNKINVAALQSDSASLLGCSTATLRQRVEPRHRKLNLGITNKPTRVRMRDLAGVRLAPSSGTKLKPIKNKNRKTFGSSGIAACARTTALNNV